MTSPVDNGSEGMSAPGGAGGGVDKDDALLTAYLDGELGEADRAALDRRLLAEPQLKARLDHLGSGGRPFGLAYEALLAAAPVDRLRARLNELAGHALSESDPTDNVRGTARRLPRSLLAIAAAVVIFAAGVIAGHLLPGVTQAPEQARGWRQVVAEYQSLTTAASLSAIPESPQTVSGELAAVGGTLALDLSPDKVVLPDVALKRAQLYEFNGKPLAQIAYLSPESGPIALCIINNGRGDEDVSFEKREGYNIVFWNTGGRGYMLIGKAPRTMLEAFASDLRPRIS
jgi:anti-sigma factor RsiW